MAAVVVVALGVRATAGDPLTVRIISYMINLLLLGAATVQLDSGRRMGTAAILVHGVVSLLDHPYGYMADEVRSVHFTFTSSAAAALNTEFLAAVAPATYLTFLARMDVLAKITMAFLSVLNLEHQKSALKMTLRFQSYLGYWS